MASVFSALLLSYDSVLCSLSTHLSSIPHPWTCVRDSGVWTGHFLKNSTGKQDFCWKNEWPATAISYTLKILPQL